MKNYTSSTAIFLGLAVALGACSKADVAAPSVKEVVQSEATSVAVAANKESNSYDYVSMEGFSHKMAKFVGLTEGEAFAESEAKINAVFKAYDGQTQPVEISMDSQIVEAGWKQVVVTQNGLMDGTVAGQQLLAIFDDEKKLVAYGMRIKCDTPNGSEKWQKHGCE